MSIIGSNILAGASGQGGGYTIERSLRFRSSASAYLNRTPASAGNTKTWTQSFWFKRGQLGVQQDLYSPYYGGDGANEAQMYFKSDDTFAIYDSGANAGYMYYVTTQVFRDPSAWYHFVIACDTTQATASNRLKIYVNGVQITSFSTSQTQNQNTNTGWNGTSLQRIGCYARSISSLTDGYFAEFNNIDGQALDPTYFGEYNADTGVWQPIKYSGSYGTNGFYLPFSDNTTTTTLVADASGNGNNWTPNNISLTSGATYDSMTDTPTPYADGGNYCTLNSAIRPYPSNTDVITNSNLTFSSSFASVSGSAWGTTVLTSGKWYFEGTLTTAGPSNNCIGFSNNTIAAGLGTYVADARTYGWFYQSSGQKTINSTTTSYGTSYTTGDVIGIALDIDSATIEFFKNGSSQGQLTGLSLSSGSSGWLPAVEGFNGTVWNTNFGQRPFAYTPPTGFKPLHTGNLPDSAIVDGSEYFDAVTYTGNGYPTSGTQSISTVNFQPDFVWIKDRSRGGYNHFLQDVLRGSTNVLRSNTTGAANTESTAVTSFNADGFSLGASNEVNYQNDAFISWNWKANGAGVSNTDGSITSTVSANPTAGFSIVTYTGTGANATVGHSLGTAPSMVIVKDRSNVEQWAVYHKNLTSANYVLYLDSTAAQSIGASWNSTNPTSSVVSLGGGSVTNQSGHTYVAYCFAEVEGYSKFGSYTGNGSADGPFVYLGFKPRFILFKKTSAADDWVIYDTARDEYNVASKNLFPNGSFAEDSNTTNRAADILSNGFKLRSSGSFLNGSGATFIFAAFAENPFKNSLAR